MRLRVIATDYDGTIARDGVLDPAVRKAIANARRRGVLVVIVTGRILYVRHQTKYFNNPVPDDCEFVFTDNGQAVGESAATLRELAGATTRVAANVLTDHNQRHDFSRWIASQFCDRELANDVRQLESRHNRNGLAGTFAASLSEAIERRYEST